MAASDGRKGRPWRRLREQVLREEPVCRYCRVRPSTVVDHVLPRSRYPELAHDRTNLAGACGPCNTSKHDRFPGQWRPKLTPPRSTRLTW